jgi:hypothetical protein
LNRRQRVHIRTIFGDVSNLVDQWIHDIRRTGNDTGASVNNRRAHCGEAEEAEVEVERDHGDIIEYLKKSAWCFTIQRARVDSLSIDSN